ncbi:nucleotidyltransferase family protein [Parabacteroides bouchesdurhonensis]|uniref:nucleotidyltransferase family protein n=1 Tax=Parabacteroides bouchesdurhonensis TaxID=1936995 RepID=UPI000C859F8E|nr:NDP-sugar synthase [Parabacteroides bouchesdurhonensis]RHJ90506.1 NDP-sugar synthase [Bacteroides sp. AM07-16]
MDYAIIAAGEGSRLVQEGVKCPKPLVKLNGTTLIDRLIDVFLRNEASSISIIVNEEMTEVQEYLNALQLPVPFYLLVKSTPSSMHSFYELSRYLDGDKVCLTTVDTIFKEDEFSGYIHTFQKEHHLDGLMAVTDFIDDEKPLYVKTDRNLMIQNFLDKADNNECKYVSGGIYCLKRSGLSVLNNAIDQGMSRMRNYQRQLIAEGLKLQAYPFGKIIDVDHADDILKAEQFLKS